MSVGKSVVSALVGTAIADGAIKSVDEPVTTYLPGLAGSAYDGVKIKDILGGVCGRGRNPTPSSPR